MQKPTQTDEFAQQLIFVVEKGWKDHLRFIDPHRQHVRYLCRGRSVLELGCGAGRNLIYLNRSDCYGVDHNEAAISYCKSRGLNAATSVSDLGLAPDHRFGVLLMAHLLEHLTFDDAVAMVKSHLDLLEPDARIIVMTPQEKGQTHDSSHVTYFGPRELDHLAELTNVRPLKKYSFPLPSVFGKILYFNENVFVGVHRT